MENGELITMTTDNNEENVLKVVRTVKGNHARQRLNQREVDVIAQEVMPEHSHSDSVGIITPYRNQADEINKTLGKDIASTVHKYQGRECDTIIMSTVDNEPTEFSDDANLLNVAISRAKNHLCFVTTGNDMPPESNLAQLIAYIKYNNFEVQESKLHSVLICSTNNIQQNDWHTKLLTLLSLNIFLKTLFMIHFSQLFLN